MTDKEVFRLGLARQQAGDLAGAEKFYRQILMQEPNHVQALHMLGVVAAQIGRLDAAVALIRRALLIEPNFVEARNNLGNVLKNAGQYEQAVAEFRKAIELRPGFAEVHVNLGNVLQKMGRTAEGIECYRHGLGLKPELSLAHSNLLYAMQFTGDYDERTIFEEHRKWNERHALPLKGLAQPFSNTKEGGRHLRVGYVSADFREHAVSRFLLPLFEHHDHANFEMVCYADVASPDRITEMFRKRADRWESIVGMSDQDLAEKIRGDQVDILVDVGGHTSGNRLLAFARKPAPVQISYLGYPGTTGMEAMDYRMTDGWADPPGMTESLNSERLLRLPVCSWCFAEPENSPEVKVAGDRPICFGSFNNFSKISNKTMDLWAEVMKETPGSEMFIKSRGLDDEVLRRRMIEQFGERGVGAERLRFSGYVADAQSHLEFYNLVDIALDTFPYHGTTTTCEALWMGVPVVTLAGVAHVSRVGVSLLTNAGLPEFVGASPEEFISIAVNAARDRGGLGELRNSLRAKMRGSALMDAVRFARDVESAYRLVWRAWCESLGK